MLFLILARSLDCVVSFHILTNKMKMILTWGYAKKDPAAPFNPPVCQVLSASSVIWRLRDGAGWGGGHCNSPTAPWPPPAWHSRLPLPVLCPVTVWDYLIYVVLILADCWASWLALTWILINFCTWPKCNIL